jgi:hypothetical protein
MRYLSFFFCIVVLCSKICFISSQDDKIQIQRQLQAAKLDLWSRGAYDLDEQILFGLDPWEQLEQMKKQVVLAPFRLGPVKRFISDHKSQCNNMNCLPFQLRGGGIDKSLSLEEKIQEMGKSFGTEFLEAIEQVRKSLSISFIL